MRAIPKRFYLLAEDSKEKISNGAKLWVSRWTDNYIFEEVSHSFWLAIGKTPAQANYFHLNERLNERFAVEPTYHYFFLNPKPIEPRFKCEKPFPYGY